MDSLIGTMLGQYQIIEEIGRGGMATVYKAYQPSLNRFVALKVLPDHLAHDATFITRFIREAHIAEALKHPNIIEIYEVSRTEPYFIAMQLIEGETLTTVIHRERVLPSARAAQILRQIASALDYAHARGVIHRDVKPSNIMLDRAGNAILTDFGIAKAVEGTRLTQTGGFMGTPEYVAPEQIQGHIIDSRADIYALGIVCYEMLSGRVPFQGDTLRVLHAQAYEVPSPLRSLNLHVTPVVEQAVARALAKNPAARFSTATEFVLALSCAPTPASTAPESPTRFAPQSRKTSSATLPIIAGVVGGIILLIVITALATVRNNWNNPPVAFVPISATDIVAPNVPALLPTAASTTTPIPTGVSTSAPTLKSTSAPIVTQAVIEITATPVIPTQTFTATPTRNAPSTSTLSLACANPQAQITDPRTNAQVRRGSVLKVVGTANRPDFGFYRVQYQPQGGRDWGILYTGKQPVNNDVLMEWHTDTVNAGTYGLRLIVEDHTGNYADPCEVWFLIQ